MKPMAVLLLEIWLVQKPIWFHFLFPWKFSHSSLLSRLAILSLFISVFSFYRTKLKTLVPAGSFGANFISLVKQARKSHCKFHPAGSIHQLGDNVLPMFLKLNRDIEIYCDLQNIVERDVSRRHSRDFFFLDLLLSCPTFTHDRYFLTVADVFKDHMSFPSDRHKITIHRMVLLWILALKIVYNCCLHAILDLKPRVISDVIEIKFRLLPTSQSDAQQFLTVFWLQTHVCVHCCFL